MFHLTNWLRYTFNQLQQDFERLGGADCKLCGCVTETTRHALRDCPRAMQLWLHKVPENIKRDLFSMDLVAWIDLNINNSRKWASY